MSDLATWNRVCRNVVETEGFGINAFLSTNFSEPVLAAVYFWTVWSLTLNRIFRGSTLDPCGADLNYLLLVMQACAAVLSLDE